MIKSTFVNKTYYIENTETDKLIGYIEEYGTQYIAKPCFCLFNKTFDNYEDALNYILAKQ